MLKQITNGMNKYLFSSTPTISGISIILANIKKRIDVELITNLDSTTKDDLIIPYGIIDAAKVLEKYNKLDLVFLVDSSTLCCKSVVEFYIKYRIYNFKEILRNLVNFYRFKNREEKIIRNSQKVIVVSPYDKKYLENRYQTSNIYCIPNGIDICQPKIKNIPKDRIVLGVISHWSKGAFLDLEWFLKHYYPEIKKVNPKVEIIIAGRNAEQYMIDYWESFGSGISFVGEVRSLESFFNGIDIYLSTVRKSCGILNKVLDSWAHNTYAIGLPNNFYAFEKLETGYRTFTCPDSLNYAISDVVDNWDANMKQLEDVRGYLNKEHNWDLNYDKLLK